MLLKKMPLADQAHQGHDGKEELADWLTQKRAHTRATKLPSSLNMQGKSILLIVSLL